MIEKMEIAVIKMKTTFRCLEILCAAVVVNIGFFATAHAQDARRMLLAGCVYIEQNKSDDSRGGMSVSEYCSQLVEQTCEERGGC